MHVNRRVLVLGLIALGATVATGVMTLALPAQDSTARPAGPAGIPNLVLGLKETPGCLGVETAQTTSRKQVIFAWFEDKKGVIDWYDSEMHQEVMDKFFPEGPTGDALENVEDGTSPILVIASITFADKPRLEQSPMPISQIAVELYQPLPGGVYLGGRFAPDSVKVPHLRGYASDE